MTTRSWPDMILLLTVSPLIILIVHMIITRTMKSYSRQMVAVYAVLIGYVPMTVLLWRHIFYPQGFSSDNWSTAAYCFIVYSAIGYTYFHFFNTSETARRVRLLYEIYRAGELSSEEISNLYKTSDIINLRLRRLVDMKQLSLQNGYYTINGRMLHYAAMIMLLWQKLLGFK